MKHNYFKHLFTALLLLCSVSLQSFTNTPLVLNISNEKNVESGAPVGYTDDVYLYYNGSYTTQANVTVEHYATISKLTLDCDGLSSYVYGILADVVVVEEIDGVKYFQASQIIVKYNYGNTYYNIGNLSGKMNNEKLYFRFEGSDGMNIVFGHNFSTGYNEYNINVPSAGQLGHLLLNEIEQWTDVESLTLSGSLNTADLAYLSRLTNMVVLDLSQTDITSMTGCNGLKYLKTVMLPSTVVAVEESAFSGCNLLSSISLPNVVSIGNSAFYGCNALTSIDLPKAETIGNSAFYDCEKLSKVTMPNVREISSYCFNNCKSLKDFEFPASLEYIKYSAFYGSGLTKAILPEGLKTIEYSAFRDCSLTVISIPSTVTSIESNSFNTSKVTDVYCYCLVPLPTTNFSNMAHATLHVPEFSINSYRLHDNWYNFAKTVPIEGDLEKLNINNEFAIYDYAGLADKIDITLSSDAKLTVNANSALSLGKYEQYQDLYSYDYDYDDNSYIYPYCTTLIAQNAITADSVCTHLYMCDGRWNFISFPYDVNVSDIVVPEGVLWVIRKYSGSDRANMTGNTWQNMTDGMTLKAGEGYIFHFYYEESDKVCVSFPSVSSDSGTLFAHTDVTRVLNEYPAEYAHNRSWNLVGNPYPSYFNTRDMEFNAPITVWNGDGYTAYSLLDDNYVLTPNEAFFVQRPADSNSIVFKKEGRLHYLDNYDEYRAPSAHHVSKSFSSRSVYNFVLKNSEYADRARLVVNENASMDYEINCDAGKFLSSNADVPQLYISDNGVQFAIDERPLGTGVIGLGAYFGKDGEYTLSLLDNPDSNLSVVLTDQLTGCKTDLSVCGYTFNATAGTCNNRFTVSLVNTTAIEECVADEGSACDIYTLDGKKVTGVDNLPAGVYLVKNGNKYVKRVVTK